YQKDGNLVIYRDTGSTGVQATFGFGLQATSPGLVKMQSDGNFVISDSSGRALFNTQTAGNPGAYARIEDDGNLVVRSPGGIELCSTGADPQAPPSGPGVLGANERLNPGEDLHSPDRRYRLVYQTDGNLVLYNSGGGALWSSQTSGTSAGFATMQEDGNF